MKTLIMVLAAIALSGCSALNNIDNGHTVECTANFKLESFAVAGSYPVNINRVKRDRFGRLFLRPASGKSIQFIGGGFKPAEQFSDLACKNGEVL